MKPNNSNVRYVYLAPYDIFNGEIYVLLFWKKKYKYFFSNFSQKRGYTGRVIMYYVDGGFYDGKASEYWGFPGGEREPGEDIKKVAIREFEEETGVRIKEFAQYKDVTYIENAAIVFMKTNLNTLYDDIDRYFRMAPHIKMLNVNDDELDDIRLININKAITLTEGRNTDWFNKALKEFKKKIK